MSSDPSSSADWQSSTPPAPDDLTPATSPNLARAQDEAETSRPIGASDSDESAAAVRPGESEASSNAQPPKPGDAPQTAGSETEASKAADSATGTPGARPGQRPGKIQVGSRRPQMLDTPKRAKPVTSGAAPTAEAAGKSPGESEREDAAGGAMELAVDPATASLVREGGKVTPPSKRAPLSEDLEREMAAAFASTNVEKLIAAEPDPSEVLEPESRHRGEVVRVDPEYVFLSLGGRNEASIPLRQLEERDNVPAVGDVLEVVIRGFNAEEGLYDATVPGATLQVSDWSDITEGAVVEARVTAVNTGGLSCLVNAIPGFIPASQVARYRVEDFSEFIEQRLLCVVTEANPNRGNLVLSHRAYLEREREAARQQLLDSLEPGQSLEGVVRSVRDFGAFVDLGGLDGMIHISQLSWDRIKHPSEVVKEGDKIRVRVEKVDKETGKIGLSYRDLQHHPWASAESRFPVGTVVPGVVSRAAKFGAFVKLAPGVEGLIHISELSNQRVPNVNSVVREGEEVQVKILSVDAEAQRISLSIKELLAKPAEAVEAEADEPPEAAPDPNRPKATGPLRGGTERSTGGDQFGLRW